MSANDQKRIINLQKCLKTAKDALVDIGHGDGDPRHVAYVALEKIEETDRELRYGKLKPPKTGGQLPHRRK